MLQIKGLPQFAWFFVDRDLKPGQQWPEFRIVQGESTQFSALRRNMRNSRVVRFQILKTPGQQIAPLSGFCVAEIGKQRLTQAQYPTSSVSLGQRQPPLNQMPIRQHTRHTQCGKCDRQGCGTRSHRP